MKKTNAEYKVRNSGSGQKGMVMVIVMVFTGLMVLSAAFLSTMILRDTRLIQRAKAREQARFMAEAGLHHAFAKIKKDGFDSRADFNDSLDTGSYSVTFSEIGGRYLVQSVGTVLGVSGTVSAEIEDKTPTALNYFSGAGNDITIKVHTNITDAAIAGDLHANNNVSLIVQPHAQLTITGDVSATGIVTEGNKHYNSDNKDTDLWINGVNNDGATIYEGANRITFPEFDYTKYKETAQDDGLYYSSSQVFNSQTLSPNNGIVYVDGDVTIQGTCTLNGGMIADTVTIPGTLNQVKTGDRNVIIAKEGDIQISGRLETGEALVYAEQDIYTHEQWGAAVAINGIMLAKRNISMWNFRTDIDYAYVYILPPDMTEESSGFRVISWNR